MNPLKMGVSGNLGAKSAEASRKIKTLGGSVPTNPLTKMKKPRLVAPDTNVVGSVGGPMTMGGCIGGTADKKDYSGMRAGK